jgi:hypothetical protein
MMIRCRHDVFWIVTRLGIGMGLCSEYFFVGLISGFGLWPAIAVVVAGVLVALWRGRGCGLCVMRDEIGGNPSFTRWLAVGFGLLLLVDLAIFVSESMRTPRGNWDAWAIWNLRAHFFYREGGVAWRDGFTEVLAWSHPDYPLLLPAVVAGGWKLLGRESRAVPIAVGCFFTFGSAVLMTTSIGILRGARQGLLAGIALAATPVFFVQGAMQCADVPVAFFRLASLAAMAIAQRFDQRHDRRGFAIAAGMAAALDGWTKNEGILWFAAFLISITVAMRWRLIAPFLTGALPALAPIALFKARVATSSDIFGAAGRAGMMARAVDASRYSLIVREAIKHLWSFGPLMVSPFVLLAVYLIVAGRRKGDRDRAVIRAGAAALLLTAAGYFLIYLLRDLDLRWLMDTSADRLLVQLWPAVVFVVMLSARQATFSAGPSSPGSRIRRCR